MWVGWCSCLDDTSSGTVTYPVGGGVGRDVGWVVLMFR